MSACGFGVRTAFLVVAVPRLLWRVRVEDGLMARRFGASDDACRAGAPALIPRTRSARFGARHARQ
ncbi:hypothetical protein [Streptomyces sp. MK5]|uniref:hypothetical protein n=1 Tax=Streptomyces sp. MK5 TaxID=3064253 RepID=UPI00274136B3|nr:hypothetical protein [Streptomyces sp. MK5]